MGRFDFSCQTGRKPYKKKAEVPGKPQKCDRCPWWHDKDDRPRSRRRSKR